MSGQSSIHKLERGPQMFEPCDTLGDIRLDNREDHRLATLELVSRARRNLVILSPDLEPALFNNRPFVEAISSLARRHRKSEIRILLASSEAIVRQGYRLVDLSQRLTSAIHIRVMPADYSEFNGAFLVADYRGVLYRKVAGYYTGCVNFEAPLKARQLLETFEMFWTKSELDPELRSLHL